MDPLTGVLALLAKYGAGRIAHVMGGTDADGDLLAGLITSVVAQEQAIEKRLDDIDRALEAVLEQSFELHFRPGVEYLFAALIDGRTRAGDLERSREQLMQAAGAAQTSFQRARALRYLVACLELMGRRELAAHELIKMEVAALDAQFEAASAPFDSKALDDFMRRRGLKTGLFASSEIRSSAHSDFGRLRGERSRACMKFLLDAASTAPSLGHEARLHPAPDLAADIHLPQTLHGRIGPLLLRFSDRSSVAGVGSWTIAATLEVPLQRDVWLASGYPWQQVRLVPMAEAFLDITGESAPLASVGFLPLRSNGEVISPGSSPSST